MEARMRHLLGIDPGGTKCAALLIAPDGTALKWNCHSGKDVTGRHITAISSACFPLVGNFTDPLYIALTGERHFNAGDIVRSEDVDAKFISVTESQAALALAGESYGIVLLSGTGAFAELVLPDLHLPRLDGLGPLVGDFGSGFWIGQSAFRAVSRSMMHKRHATSLVSAVKSKISDEQWHRLAHFNLNLHDRMTVASLAPIVNAEAEAGDRVSMEILCSAADELSVTVFDALDSGNALDAGHTLIGTGSVLCRSAIIWHRLVENVRKFAPNLSFKRLTDYPAVVGTALAGAKGLLEEKQYLEFGNRLLESFKSINSN